VDHVGHAVAIAEGDVHDRSAVIPHVMIVRRSADVECPREIRLYHRLEAVGGQLLGGAYELTPGIIDEQVKGAVIFDDEFHLFF
jgi:hypothetical protein